jgi:hypothetical protein
VRLNGKEVCVQALIAPPGRSPCDPATCPRAHLPPTTA